MQFFRTKITHPFILWLTKDRETVKLLWLSLLTIIVSFTWLKILYPFPNFMPPDSYSYLDAAYNKQYINMWPIGYSLFLRTIGFLSHSHFVLVVIQYLLLEISVLYCLLSIRYLLAPNKWVFRTIMAITLLNPLIPQISNFVSSDCLFTALSLIWFTQLIWIIHQPTVRLLILHSLVLLLAFIVRYNALFYPFISLFFIVFNNIPRKLKWIGPISIIVLLSIFIGTTQNEYFKKTGTIQYTAFGGWQMAANALYGYSHVNLDSPFTVPSRLRDLHRTVNQHMKLLNKVPDYLRPDRNVGVYYLWDFKSPLRLYMDKMYHNNQKKSFFTQWASMAPLYANYGRYIIMRHPISFFKYYLWPNSQRYFAPPAQFMSWYNLGHTTVDPIAVKWFKWANNKITTRTKDKKILLTRPFAIIFPIANLVFISGLLCFIGLGGLKQFSIYFRKTVLCSTAIWICNMFFSILSAPIELRYQIFPILITMLWGVIFISFIIKAITKSPNPGLTNNDIKKMEIAL